jgi:hypothetical protein
MITLQMIPKLCIALVIIATAGCSKNLSKKERADIFTLKDMNDLATVEYVVSKVVKANDNRDWFKIGDRQIIMSATGYIKAGIDLSQIIEEEQKLSGNEITIVLPPAKIISISIPPDELKQEMENVNVFRHTFSSKEREELLRQAEWSIRKTADSMDIRKKAEDNAVAFVKSFVEKLGHTNVNVVIKPSTR